MVYFRRHISFWKKNQWTVNKFIVTQCWNSFFHFINYNLVGTGMFLDGNLCFLINSKSGRCPFGIDQEIKHFFFLESCIYISTFVDIFDAQFIIAIFDKCRWWVDIMMFYGNFPEINCILFIICLSSRELALIPTAPLFLANNFNF